MQKAPSALPSALIYPYADTRQRVIRCVSGLYVVIVTHLDVESVSVLSGDISHRLRSIKK